MCTRVMTSSIQPKLRSEVVTMRRMLLPTHMRLRKSTLHTIKLTTVNVLKLHTTPWLIRHHSPITMPVLNHVCLQPDVRHSRSTRFHIHAHSIKRIAHARQNWVRRSIMWWEHKDGLSSGWSLIQQEHPNMIRTQEISWLFHGTESLVNSVFQTHTAHWSTSLSWMEILLGMSSLTTVLAWRRSSQCTSTLMLLNQRPLLSQSKPLWMVIWVTDRFISKTSSPRLRSEDVQMKDSLSLFLDSEETGINTSKTSSQPEQTELWLFQIQVPSPIRIGGVHLWNTTFTKITQLTSKSCRVNTAADLSLHHPSWILLRTLSTSTSPTSRWFWPSVRRTAKMTRHARDSLSVKRVQQMRRLVTFTTPRFVDTRSTADIRTSMSHPSLPRISSSKSSMDREPSLTQMKRMAHSGSNWVLKLSEDISQCSQVNSWFKLLKWKQRTKDVRNTRQTSCSWSLQRILNSTVTRSASKTWNVITSTTTKALSSANFRRRATATRWSMMLAGSSMKLPSMKKQQLMDQKVMELIVSTILNSVMTKFKLQHAELSRQRQPVNQQTTQNAHGLKEKSSTPTTDVPRVSSWQPVHQVLRSVMRDASKQKIASSSQWTEANVNTGRVLALADNTHMGQRSTNQPGHPSPIWELIDVLISNTIVLSTTTCLIVGTRTKRTVLITPWRSHTHASGQLLIFIGKRVHVSTTLQCWSIPRLVFHLYKNVYTDARNQHTKPRKANSAKKWLTTQIPKSVTYTKLSPLTNDAWERRNKKDGKCILEQDIDSQMRR